MFFLISGTLVFFVTVKAWNVENRRYLSSFSRLWLKIPLSKKNGKLVFKLGHISTNSYPYMPLVSEFN